jgi:protein involved in polysaccharide export with SLBB domain
VQTTDVFVNGAVGAPGLVPLRRTECDLLHAIVGAAGVSDIASGQVTLRRLRYPGEENTLDLSGPDGLRAALALDPLESGDVVTVEAAEPNSVYVGGLVNAPSPQLYPPGVQVTFLQAIAAAGGLRTDIFPREGTLIRRMPNGTDLHVKLDLDRLKTGQDPNFMLAAGDILWVPDTLATRVQDFINQNFFFRAGVSANVTYNVSGIEFLNRQDMQASGISNNQNSSGSFNPFQLLNNNPILQNLNPGAGP